MARAHHRASFALMGVRRRGMPTEFSVIINLESGRFRIKSPPFVSQVWSLNCECSISVFLCEAQFARALDTTGAQNCSHYPRRHGRPGRDGEPMTWLLELELLNAESCSLRRQALHRDKKWQQVGAARQMELDRLGRWLHGMSIWAAVA